MDLIMIGTNSILVLAFLVLLGGFIGFKKAKSKASLIAGTVSALALVACFCYTLNHPQQGAKTAFLLAGVLEGIFIARLIKTKKFMPSGMMLVLCVLEQLVLLVTMFK